MIVYRYLTLKKTGQTYAVGFDPDAYRIVYASEPVPFAAIATQDPGLVNMTYANVKKLDTALQTARINWES